MFLPRLAGAVYGTLLPTTERWLFTAVFLAGLFSFQKNRYPVFPSTCSGNGESPFPEHIERNISPELNSPAVFLGDMTKDHDPK
jgi:hypothetical protein